MRVMIALEDRFFKTQNGNIYSNTTCDYNFWSRYLRVFDEVVVLARIKAIEGEISNKPLANGPDVSFIELPYYIGLFQYLKKYAKLNKAVRQSVEKADCFILRIPGVIGTCLWKQLCKKGKSYGVEVLGDSFGSIGTAGGLKILQNILCKVSSRQQKEQCQNAIASAYVSKSYLQKIYPPKGWSTNYSSIDLPDEALIDEEGLQTKFLNFKDISDNKKPLEICHAGTMEVAYKAQDILLEAVSVCISKGLDVKLTLLGEGRLFDLYFQKAKQLKIDKYVNFLGMLPPGKAVLKQLDMSDMFVLPSTTEGLPRIVIEAMARGLPCIATNVGGIPELLDDEFLVSPYDIESLASKILLFARDSNKLEVMAKTNLLTAKEYTHSKLNAKRKDFYLKVKQETANINKVK